MSCLCSCLFLNRRALKLHKSRLQVQTNSDLDSSGSAAGEKVDLLQDEGTNLQDDLWSVCLSGKLNAPDTKDQEFYQNLHASLSGASYESSLQYLTARFEEKGFAQFIPKTQAVLVAIKPFTTAIITIAQACPGAVCLVWGSVQAVLAAADAIVNTFDSIATMLQDLSKCLPRIEAYAQLLHTPRMHEALREVYVLFIDFCIATAKILEANSGFPIFRLQCSSLARDFKSTKILLEKSTDDFEREAFLANAQAGKSRHDTVMAKLCSTEQTTLGLQARCLIFEGREDIMKDLEENLQTLLPGKPSGPRTRRSCVLHAIGGMGKTEIALEYVYRYMHQYTHIFWIRPETEAVLAESFANILDKVHPEPGDFALDKRIEMVRDYLFHTTDDWLLVFDNVQSGRSIKNFWPAGEHGTIIVTTQLCDLDEIATCRIRIPPMSPEEGSELIRAHLRRGGSEAHQAERISKELGGLPLAITHFSGFVKRSQCPLEDILDSLKQQKKLPGKRNMVADGLDFDHWLLSYLGNGVESCVPETDQRCQ